MTATPGDPTAFLDIGDVLCLCERFGAREALAAVKAELTDGHLVYRTVMHVPAVAVLREMHEQMGGTARSSVYPAIRANR